MKSLLINRILRKVAKENGVSPAQVKSGIQEAIDLCWNNPDPEIHAKLAAMSATGNCPTVEETILLLAAKASVDDQIKQMP